MWAIHEMDYYISIKVMLIGSLNDMELLMT